MFEKPISIAFAPNVEKDDLELSIKLLFGQKPAWAPVDPVGKLEDEFKKYFATKYAVSFSSGRAALYYSLLALGLEKDDEVLTQALTCVAVPNSIIWAGLKPVYVDIDPQSFNLDPKDLEKKITNRSKVLIVQHTFGIPAPLPEILKIAKKHNLIVIEDCAHSLGVTYSNKPIGSYGDVAIFSFGRDKMISSVFGGLTLTKDIRIYHKLEKFSQALISPPGSFVNQQLLYPTLYTISIPLYSLLIGKFFIKMASVFGILSKAVTPAEKIGKKPDFINYKFSPKLALLALNQFKKLGWFLEHRKRVVGHYDTFLNLKEPISSRGKGRLLPLLRYPLLVKDKQRLIKSAKSQGMYIGDWYDSPIALGSSSSWAGLSKFYYSMGSCPVAERVSKSIVNLPTHINLSLKQTERVGKFINENAKEVYDKD